MLDTGEQAGWGGGEACAGRGEGTWPLAARALGAQPRLGSGGAVIVVSTALALSALGVPVAASPVSAGVESRAAGSPQPCSQRQHGCELL